MERDFMGLNSKDSAVMVKQEVVDLCKESVYPKSSAIHWPTSDGFEAAKNRQAAEIQKSVGVGRQGGSHHYSMAAGYPVQQSPYSMQLINDAKQAIPITMTNPFFRTQFGGAPVKQHGVSVPSIGSFLAGTTEPWYSTKTTSAPAQLTIFYGGMVNVYDDISPEKAQAIMFLAGNGASASTTPQPRVQTLVPVSQPINVQPCSAMSSPMSVSSHPVGQSIANKDDAAKAAAAGGSVTRETKVDTPRVINSLEQVMQSAVPQARKASLARFLEKRKERAMASAPYNVTKDLMSSAGPSSMNAVTAAGEH